MTTLERTENTRQLNDADDTQEPARRTTERGHLALVEWDVLTAPAANGRRAASVRWASMDRLYEGGIILLMLASTLAAIASFARL